MKSALETEIVGMAEDRLMQTRVFTMANGSSFVLSGRDMECLRKIGGLRHWHKLTRRKPGRKLGLARAHGGRLTRKRCRRWTFLDFFKATSPTMIASPQDFMDDVDRMSEVTAHLTRDERPTLD